ncbi:LiaF transmembrane domain-containing protein [Povalibacter sp.]|uniref:LiaF transmembrane domain-containing protein n=1 Tax=Povalibacter sp. TaxID=1962978 RepID=UPI002F3E9F67
MSHPTRQSRRSPLATGILLIVLGGMLLAFNLGWSLPQFVWDYWPVVLMLPGVIAIAAPSRHLNRSGGIWLLATGIYCQIGVSDLFGLGWFTAWPIFVIAYGIDLVIGSGRQPVECGEREDRVSHEG